MWRQPVVSPPNHGKHAKTHEAIFAEPIRSNVRWDDIESLFKSLSGIISEGAGSRVRVSLDGCDAVFHRPHPEKECSKPALRSVRKFLINVGCCHDPA